MYLQRHTKNGRDFGYTGDQILSPRLSLSGRLAYKGTDAHGTATVVELDGRTWQAGPTDGIAAVAWGEDETLYVLNPGARSVTIFAPDGTPAGVIDLSVRYPNSLPAAEGIHHVDGANPILANDPLVAFQVIRGIECHRVDRDTDGTAVALAGGGGPHGCVVKIPVTGPIMMWIATADVLEAVYISQGRVSIPGFDTPEPGAVPWVSYADAPIVVPSVKPRKPAKPMLYGTFGTPNRGGNVGGSGHPIAVIDGPDYITADDAKRLRGVIFDPFYLGNPSHNPEQIEKDFQNCLSWARRTGCPVVVYDDGHDVSDICRRLRVVERVGVVHAILHNPRIYQQAKAPDAGAALCAHPLYRGAWSEPELANWTQVIIERNIATETQWSGELVIGLGRNAPQDAPPWARDYYDAKEALLEPLPANFWDTWPQTTIESPIVVTPQPSAGDETPTKPKGGGSKPSKPLTKKQKQVAGAAAAGGGILMALARIFHWW
jgi:hypothetical protein